MLLTREIIAISPLARYPGYWLLTGRTEGEFGIWHVIRKPNGTYWAALMPMGAENETAVVEIGDRVTDARAVAQFECGFLRLRNVSEGPLTKKDSIEASL